MVPHRDFRGDRTLQDRRENRHELAFLATSPHIWAVISRSELLELKTVQFVVAVGVHELRRHFLLAIALAFLQFQRLRRACLTETAEHRRFLQLLLMLE